MLANPILHAQIMADVGEDWVLLCTGKGFRYVNINPDSNDEAPADIEQLSSSPCCVYDVVPEVVATLFDKEQPTCFIYHNGPQHALLTSYQTHYFSRAPPVNFRLI